MKFNQNQHESQQKSTRNSTKIQIKIQKKFNNRKNQIYSPMSWQKRFMFQEQNDL